MRTFLRHTRRALGRGLVRIPSAWVRLWVVRAASFIATKVHGRGPKTIPLDGRTGPVPNALFWSTDSHYPKVLEKTQITSSQTVLLEDFSFAPKPPGHVFGDRFVFRIESATVHATTGLVFAPDGRIVTPSGAPLRDIRSTSRGTAAAEEVRLSTLRGRGISMDRQVFPIGIGPAKNYFHWNVDVLPRVLHAARAFPQLVVVAPQLPKFAIESLDLAGVEFVLTNEILLPQEVILVDFSDAGWMHPTDAELLRGFARSCVETRFNHGDRRKIFLSRSDTWDRKFGTRNRRLSEEQTLESRFAEAGFSVIVPARLSFLEQISAISGATIVVGVHGAGMSNILWGLGRLHVVEILSEAFYDPGPRRLAGARGDRYTSVVAHPHRDNHFGDAREVLDEVLDVASQTASDNP